VIKFNFFVLTFCGQASIFLLADSRRLVRASWFEYKKRENDL